MIAEITDEYHPGAGNNLTTFNKSEAALEPKIIAVSGTRAPRVLISDSNSGCENMCMHRLDGNWGYRIRAEGFLYALQHYFMPP